MRGLPLALAIAVAIAVSVSVSVSVFVSACVCSICPPPSLINVVTSFAVDSLEKGKFKTKDI